MQGLHDFIPTDTKVAYINQLLQVGFDTLDFGSFVSPKAIPQMRDTAEVLERLDLSRTATKLLAIVANERGAEDACRFEPIRYLGYPFSISETFQQRNTNASIAESLERTKVIQELCSKHGKELVLYISMGFGNPYGDPWSIGLLVEWVGKLHRAGARIIPLSNVSTEIGPDLIREVFSTLIPLFPGVEFGLHLHTANEGWYDKVDAAYKAGCRRFDGVINGWGGCPMAGKKLLGNLKTENLLLYAAQNGIETGTDNQALLEVYRTAREVFGE